MPDPDPVDENELSKENQEASNLVVAVVFEFVGMFLFVGVVKAVGIAVQADTGS